MATFAYTKALVDRLQNAPDWLPWGLGLLGILGGITSANLMLADRDVSPVPLSTPIAAGAARTEPAPSSTKTQANKGPEDPDDSAADATRARRKEEGTAAVAGTNQTDFQTAKPRTRPVASPAAAAAPSSSMKQGPTAGSAPPRAERIQQPHGGPDSGQSPTASLHAPAATTGMRSSAPANGPFAEMQQADSAPTVRQTHVPPHSLGPDRASAAGSRLDPAEPLRAQAKDRGDSASGNASGGTTSDCPPLFSLRFNHGSAVPRDRGIEEKAARMAQWLKSHPQAILYIDGHADATGPEEINLVISYRRAAATASLIEKAGARRSQLVPRAYGEGPSAAQTTRSQPQRRVTLTTDAERACGKPGFSDGGPE